MRNAECKGERRGASDLALQLRIPHSALRTPHWGGTLARTSSVGGSYGALLHSGRDLTRGAGSLVRVPRIRTAGGPVPAALRAAGGRHAAARRAGGAVALLPGGHDGAGQGAQGRGHVDD